MDAHLALDRAAHDGITLTRISVIAQQELGHHEQRNTLGPLGRIGRPCEHEMDDVFGKVVFACRNEDLGPSDRKRAVRLRLGLGANQTQIGAALRLGQVHGAEPLVGDHLGQPSLLKLGRSLGQQRVDRAAGQARIHREGHVGRGPEFLDRKAKHMRQALPAELLGRGERAPARFAELPVRLLEPGGSCHRSVLLARTALLVARRI